MATKKRAKKPTRPPRQGTKPAKPLGLLPVPDEVRKFVMDSIGHFATPEAIQSQLNALTLDYYYGGELVLVREDERGIHVCAAGDDVFAAERALTFAERSDHFVAHPLPWNSIQI